MCCVAYENYSGIMMKVDELVLELDFFNHKYHSLLNCN